MKFTQQCVIENTIANTMWYWQRYLECDVLFISFLSSFFICIKPPIALVMRSPNLYQYTAIGGFTHAKAIFLPPVEPGVYFHAWRHQKKKDTIHIVSFLARKEGFEPSRRFWRPTPLAGEPLRPLGYFRRYEIYWRREWDSNPRMLSHRRFSRPVLSTTQPSLRA